MSTPLRQVESEESKTPSRHARGRRVWLPLLVLAGAAGVVALLFATRPAIQVEPPNFLPPLVRVLEVQPEILRLNVEAEGSVDAAVRSDLVAEVSGRILALGPALVEGGWFREGEVLLRLDDREYQVAREKARAAVERGESETALAERRLARWQQLVAEGVVSVDQVDDGENQAKVARASLRTARADLAQAELDLERSILRAPYEGRVSTREVDRGQYVARGARLATIYAIDRAEVRLAVPDEALAHLGIPLDFRAAEGQRGPRVTLRARVAGSDAEWEGQIERTEGQIDPRTRLVTLVAEVADPFRRETNSSAPPLAPGLFVGAEIEGREVPGAVRLPSGALRAGDEVLVVEEEKLRFRPVTVLRRERDSIVIGAGLKAGDAVCVSSLEAATDGMQVRRAPSP